MKLKIQTKKVDLTKNAGCFPLMVPEFCVLGDTTFT